jgi:dTDP-4-dehydrorhamnose 3,5-epimerase
VIIDLRPESPTVKRWTGIESSADNRAMMYVPAGFAHGFLALVDESEVIYQMSVPYHLECARGVRWNDPCFGITWPMKEVICSDRDNSYAWFSDSD